MKKISILLVSLFVITFTYGQSVTQINTLPTPQQLTSSKSNVNAQLNFNQISQNLLSQANRTPEGYIRCATTEVEQMRRAVNPNIETEAQFESWIEQKIKELPASSTLKASRNIPVVVHVIHNGD